MSRPHRRCTRWRPAAIFEVDTFGLVSSLLGSNLFLMSADSTLPAHLGSAGKASTVVVSSTRPAWTWSVPDRSYNRRERILTRKGRGRYRYFMKPSESGSSSKNIGLQSVMFNESLSAWNRYGIQYCWLSASGTVNQSIRTRPRTPWGTWNTPLALKVNTASISRTRRRIKWFPSWSATYLGFRTTPLCAK